MYISIHSLFEHDAKSLEHLILGSSSHSSLQLHQVGWAALVHRYFHISPEMFN